MPKSERTRSVRIELDRFVGLEELETAALDFARTAPGELIAHAIEAMVDDLVDAVVGPYGFPRPVRAQLVAPWCCTGCGSRRGFRRRGYRPKPRKVLTSVGEVAFVSRQLECQRCGRRFAPANEVLGLRSHQRRSDRLAEMAAGLAGETAYAKTSRLLAELAGPEVSARTIRNDVVAIAPEHISPPEHGIEVPILLLDGTGERAGPNKGGVQLHIAIGLIARHRTGKRINVEARLLAATVDEPWSVMGELLESADVRPGVVIVDGEESLGDMVSVTFTDVPIQRCLFHLQRGWAWLARYKDRCSADFVAEAAYRLEELLTDAYHHRDLDAALAAYDALVADLIDAGALKAAGHLQRARAQVFTFITQPDAGRLLFGDKGRPELGTGVVERVMRELNRRTDVGVRWSIDGVRAILMIKLQHKYGHGPWSPQQEATRQPRVRMSLAA